MPSAPRGRSALHFSENTSLVESIIVDSDSGATVWVRPHSRSDASALVFQLIANLVPFAGGYLFLPAPLAEVLLILALPEVVLG